MSFITIANRIRLAELAAKGPLRNLKGSPLLTELLASNTRSTATTSQLLRKLQIKKTILSLRVVPSQP